MPTPRQHANRAEKQRVYRERQKQAREAEQAVKGLPALPAISTMPGAARWRALVEAARLHLETARSEMEDYASERSEQWQESERGEEHARQVEVLETALASLEELV